MENYWPELEYWVQWHSWVALLVALGAMVIGFVTNRWARAAGIALLGFLTLYAIALTEKINTKPERDYAYFYVPDGQDPLPDGKVMLHRRATGPLSSVAFALALARDSEKNLLGKYQYSSPSTRFPEGTGYAFPIETGYWLIDVDPLSRKGQVREKLHIEIKNGKVVIVFAQVRRKFGTQEILCETPQRKSIPLCQ